MTFFPVPPNEAKKIADFNQIIKKRVDKWLKKTGMDDTQQRHYQLIIRAFLDDLIESGAQIILPSKDYDK